MDYSQTNSIICKSNYVVYTVSVDSSSNITWPENIVLDMNDQEQMANFFKTNNEINNFLQWDWQLKSSGSTQPPFKLPSWTCDINIKLISGKLRYKTFNGRWAFINPGDLLHLSIIKEGYYPSYTYSINSIYNGLESIGVSTIKVTVYTN